MKTTGVVFAIVVGLSLPGLGCKSQKADPAVVVTSIHPVYDLVRRVGGDKVKVQLLLTPGASAHDFQPSTKQMKQASRAGSAFIIGLGLDEWTTKLVKSASKKARMIRLGDKVKAVKFDFKHVGGEDDHKGHKDDHKGHKEDDHKGHKKEDDHKGHKKDDDHKGHKKDDDHKGHKRDDDHKGHKDDDHKGDKKHDDHDKHKGHKKDDHKKGADERKGDHDHHDHGDGPDPHIWLSVPKAMAMVQVIADELTKLQPKHEKYFRANAAKLLLKLKALHNEVKREVATFKNKNLVTFHGSFGYFAAEYGLHIVAVIEPYPGRNPSPAYLKKVIAAIKKQPVAALFTEPQLDARPAKALASEASLPLKELDPIGGTGGRDSYEALIRYNLEQLSETMK